MNSLGDLLLIFLLLGHNIQFKANGEVATASFINFFFMVWWVIQDQQTNKIYSKL